MAQAELKFDSASAINLGVLKQGDEMEEKNMVYQHRQPAFNHIIGSKCGWGIGSQPA